MTKRRVVLWPYLLILLLASFALCLAAPFSWTDKMPLSDSTIFLYIGKSMNSGLTLYQSLFDHKGPLLFLINAVGLRIGGEFGVWLLGVASIFISFWFSFKTCLLFAKRIPSLLAVLSLIPALINCFEGGNYSEEYALPFISISLFIFTKYFLDSAAIKKAEIVITGFCLGAVFLLRANMIALWICFCISIFLQLCFKKEGKRLLSFVLLFLSGFLLCLLPFTVYFLFKGCLSDAIYQSLTFNFLYSGEKGARLLSMAKWVYSFLADNYLLLVLLAYLGILFFGKSDSNRPVLLHLTNGAFIFLTLVLVCISRRMYLHYFLVFIPCAVIPSCYVFQGLWQLLSQINRKNAAIYSTIFLGVLLCSLHFRTAYNYVSTCRQMHRASQDDEYKVISRLIQENSQEGDTIYTHRLNGVLYLTSSRESATKYFSLPAADLNYFPKIETEFIDDLEKNQPIFIAVRKDALNLHATTDQKMLAIIDSSYHLYYSTDNIDLYQLTPQV